MGWSDDGTGTTAGFHIYIDGVEATRSTVSDTLAGASVTGTSNVTIGGRPDGSSLFTGVISAARIWGNSLSAQDWASLSSSGNIASTGPKNNLVVVGDSHMYGYGQTTNIPSSLTPASGIFSLNNLAVNGQLFSTIADSQHVAAVDALYNPSATRNILLVEGGGNDMLGNNQSPASTYNLISSYCTTQRGKGWKIILYGMYSRNNVGYNNETGDQLHDELNALFNNGWTGFADYYINIGAEPNVGPDNSYYNTNYFQSDRIHIASSYVPTLAGLVSNAIDGVQ